MEPAARLLVTVIARRAPPPEWRTAFMKRARLSHTYVQILAPLINPNGYTDTATRLLDAAERLFGKHGYDSVGMRLANTFAGSGKPRVPKPSQFEIFVEGRKAPADTPA